MAIKVLQKAVKSPAAVDDKVEKFILQGGSLASSVADKKEDHRLTLRIPCWLMDKIDEKRKERVGTISRNLFILEVLDNETKD